MLPSVRVQLAFYLNHKFIRPNIPNAQTERITDKRLLFYIKEKQTNKQKTSFWVDSILQKHQIQMFCPMITNESIDYEISSKIPQTDCNIGIAAGSVVVCYRITCHSQGIRNITINSKKRKHAPLSVLTR